VGLEDYVANDSDEFVAKGLRLAADYEALYRLRTTFRERIQKSILGQPEAIATGLNHALRAVWIRWCQGSSPELV
jgi:predicted O-linked N-acetylglucosamine transferase (SPINDLY family)